MRMRRDAYVLSQFAAIINKLMTFMNNIHLPTPPHT